MLEEHLEWENASYCHNSEGTVNRNNYNLSGAGWKQKHRFYTKKIRTAVKRLSGFVFVARGGLEPSTPRV